MIPARQAHMIEAQLVRFIRASPPPPMHNASPQPGPDEQREERRLGAVIVGLMIVELLIITIILAALGVAVIAVASIAILIVAGTGLLVAGLIRVFWNGLARRYPAQPTHPDAVTRSMQSVSLGGLGRFNNCVRITADLDHLHLNLIAPFRIFGARQISIPWSDITDVERSLLYGMSSARVAGRRIHAPTWCLTIADDPPDAPAPDAQRNHS